jgi:hypothetical protein
MHMLPDDPWSAITPPGAGSSPAQSRFIRRLLSSSVPHIAIGEAGPLRHDRDWGRLENPVTPTRTTWLFLLALLRGEPQGGAGRASE